MSECSYRYCQFSNHSVPLVTVNGKVWCIGHLPFDPSTDNKLTKDFEKLVDEHSNLDGVIFPPNYDLVVKHNHHKVFTNAVFHCRVDFVNKEFNHSKTPCFHNTVFKDLANFRGAKFIGELSGFFQECTFEKQAIFTDAEFTHTASFSHNVQFNEDADFMNTRFRGHINFANTTFLKGAHFDIETTDDNEKIITSASFRGATFHSDLVFHSRNFTGYVNFSNCTFHKAPYFHGCNIHEDIQFPEIDAFLDTSSEDAESCYQRLRKKMGEMKSHKFEAMFFALEQRAKRKQKKINKVEKAVSYIYDLSSHYGQSFVRPFLFLLLSLLLFALIYSGISSPSIHPTLPFDWHLIHQSFLLSLEQVIKPFSFFGTHRLSEAANFIIEKSPFWLIYLTLIQSITSLTLIALIVLGIRWQFRRA